MSDRNRNNYQRGGRGGRGSGRGGRGSGRGTERGRTFEKKIIKECDSEVKHNLFT